MPLKVCLRVRSIGSWKARSRGSVWGDRGLMLQPTAIYCANRRANTSSEVEQHHSDELDQGEC